MVASLFGIERGAFAAWMPCVTRRRVAVDESIFEEDTVDGTEPIAHLYTSNNVQRDMVYKESTGYRD